MKPLLSHLAELFIRHREVAGPVNAALMFAGAFTACLFRSEHRELFGLEIFTKYLAAPGHGDVLFHLSHRHYLSKKLSYRQRVRCALTHYRYEGEHHDGRYKDAVYGAAGLTLWSTVMGETCYRVKLHASTDLRHEGGISAVLVADDVNLCEMSFSWVDADIFGLGGGVIPFITRNQSARHDSPALLRFREAFPQNSPRYFCLAALEGVMLAHGATRVAAVRHDSQVGFSDEFAGGFRRSYCEFWESFGATALDRQAQLLPLPMALTPLSEVKAKHRKRALDRRRWRSAITQGAKDTILLYRTAPVPAEPRPGAPGILTSLMPHLPTAMTLAMSF